MRSDLVLHLVFEPLCEREIPTAPASKQPIEATKFSIYNVTSTLQCHYITTNRTVGDNKQRATRSTVSRKQDLKSRTTAHLPKFFLFTAAPGRVALSFARMTPRLHVPKPEPEPEVRERTEQNVIFQGSN